MTDRGGQQQGRSAPDTPGDIPDERPSSLQRLDVLLGKWKMEATFEAGYFGPGSPAIAGRSGHTTFDWLDGRFFLTQRFAAAPSGIAIIGVGTDPDTFEQHYYDSRGVPRAHHMSLDSGVWKLWREAPGFWQRSTGTSTSGGGPK